MFIVDNGNICLIEGLSQDSDIDLERNIPLRWYFLLSTLVFPLHLENPELVLQS